MTLHNEDNLRPVRTKEEARERGRNGGIKSGEARRRKKTMRDAAKMLLDMEIPKGNATKEIRARMQAMGIEESDSTYQMAIMIGAVTQAMKGNIQAATFIRDTIGENPNLELRERELEMQQAQEEGGSSLADAIEDAYRKRMEGEENAE
ncbi:MAG: hypothetical protein Q4B26_07960 [Eubacteriales bacterium]|nr:hypothetical protein [Eubacteriales bacterium]